MDKKTTVVLLSAIFAFMIVSLFALWLDPFQDSTVGGQITGTVKISNVTIPLGDIIKLARGDYTRTVGNSQTVDLNNVRDIGFGNVQVEVSFQGDGKNLEKMIRGLMVAQLPSSSYTVAGNTRIDFPRFSDSTQIIFDIAIISILIPLLLVIWLVMIKVLIKLRQRLFPKEFMSR